MKNPLDLVKSVVATVLNKEPVLLVTGVVAAAIVAEQVLIEGVPLSTLVSQDYLLGIFYVAGSWVMRATVWANDTHEDKVTDAQVSTLRSAARSAQQVDSGTDAHATEDPRYPR